MDLHGHDAGADIARDLLIEPAIHEMRHHFALAGGQRLQALMQQAKVALAFATGPIAFQADLNGIEQILVAKRSRPQAPAESPGRCAGEAHVQDQAGRSGRQVGTDSSACESSATLRRRH
jgi:hypothetical protein